MNSEPLSGRDVMGIEGQLRLVSSETEAVSITNLFHRINRLLPSDQEVVCIPLTMRASEALTLMKDRGFSQLPVREGSEIIGIFSYRSFALECLTIDTRRQSPGDLPVEEFMDVVYTNDFARITDDFDSIFDRLDRYDSVLVGDTSLIQGIVTPMDVLRYLYGVASPFVLVAEIELALRALIGQSVDRDELTECVANSLSQQYQPDRLPSSLEEMTFNDYVQVIGDGRNWSKFQNIFGGTRERTRARLTSIRDLRNDIFHMRRPVTVEDHQALVAHRGWVLARSRVVEARGLGSSDNG